MKHSKAEGKLNFSLASFLICAFLSEKEKKTTATTSSEQKYLVGLKKNMISF